MESTNLPKLPGYSFRDPTKTNFHKHQMFGVRDGHMTESTKYYKEDLNSEPIQQLLKSTQKFDTGANENRPSTPKNYAIPRIPPVWLKYDRHVLRFYAYFQEAVNENPNENFRVRKCVIMHHLDDETTYVTEPRIENSGIPQGVFIKKHKIPKGEGHYGWEDFGVQRNIEIYGRVFRIVDADDFTRNFFMEQGVELAPAEAYPGDTFDKTRLLVNYKQNPPDAMEVKEYNEVKLGGGHPNRNLKSFIANDRKVLSFDIMWEDNSYDGGLKLYKMNYYLADDTIEIQELRQVNTGNETFPMMLRRMKVPKEPILTPCPALSLKQEVYYTYDDFMIGNKVKIYGKECQIYGCDDYTRNWYRENLNIDQKPLPIQRPPNYVPLNPVPPHNGYGTEEDSIGNVLKLMPNAPKPDMYKIFDNDQHVLRYECKLISSTYEDELRKFILCFYPSDDTIKVFEVVERNSGIVGGKFLERRKFKNPYTKSFYDQKEFLIGNTIVLQNFRFLLTNCDEYTFNYMENKSTDFPQASYPNILRKIMSYGRNNRQGFLIELLKNIDPSLGNMIAFKVFLQALEKLSIKLTFQEEASLIRKWNKGNFQISMQEVYDSLINS
jgi:EF-hand domain-containing protein 1